MTAVVVMAAAAVEAAGAATPAMQSTPSAPPSKAPAANDTMTLYALGVLLSQNPNLVELSLSDSEFKQVLAGFTDGYRHKDHIADLDSYLPKIQALHTERQQAYIAHQKQVGAEFIAKVAALPGARKMPSGLVYLPSAEGSGRSPSATDRVTVQYTGKFIDGTEFDSSLRRGQPATFPLSNVIPCWTEALQLMKPGGKARVVCPSNLAYGDQGRRPVIRPAATLDFQVELLSVQAAPAAPPPGSATPPAAPRSPPNTAPSPNH